MNSLKHYILQQVYNHSLTKDEAKEYLVELEKNSVETEQMDIAVIGMSGRFPLADNLEQYWDIIFEGRNCIRDYPKERYLMTENFLKSFYMNELIHDNCLDANGNIKTNYQHRGFLSCIDKFDAEFFGISPREAKAMDPDQRVFLECAYEAMEDGGYSGQSIYGKKVGVFVGVDHVEELKYKRLASSDPMVVTGTWPGVLAGRLSYLFDFKAPSMVIDTACSSGLVSVHQGCRAIRNGECEMAICGGLSSFIYTPIVFSNQIKELESIETQDDMVRTFDNDAKGTTWGEGVGVVLLKPLKKALEEGDVIHAVIKGSAINNDGASNGLTAPNVDAQQQLLLDAWKDAKVNPESIQYIEAHGTGTVLGDPIEIKAIENAFKKHTNRKQFCGVGSVKPNIGHLVGASGMASLIKVIKMLENRTMPPSINFITPNRFINFINSPVFLNDKNIYWRRTDTPRRAGINSFGFSGTNCHVVLEEAPTKMIHDAILDRVSVQDSRNYMVFTISAKKKDLLKTLVERTIKTIEKTEMTLESICYTANTCRGHYGERVAIMAKDLDDLISKLKYINYTEFENINKFGVYFGSFKIVSESKQSKAAYEISEGQQRRLSTMAEEKLIEYLEYRDYTGLFELCNLYIKGAEIKWEKLYEGKKVTKVRLPVYPLERKTYWYYKEHKENTTIGNTQKIAAFIDKLSANTAYGDIYTTKLSPRDNWVLSDHIILGQYIIPGTTYVEMTCELMQQYYGIDIRIENMVFYSPCVIGKDEIREIQSIVNKVNDHHEIIYMSCNEAGEWEKHAGCSVFPGRKTSNSVVDLNEIRNKLKAQTGDDFIHSENSESAIVLGERWNNEYIDTRGKTAVLCRMELRPEILSDLDNSFIHVAMFDNAINAVSQDVGKGLYLPYYYKTIEFYDKMPANFFSYIRLKLDNNDNEMDSITYDVDLIKDNGIVFANIQNYNTKKVSTSAISKIKNAYSKINNYSVRWIKEEAPEAKVISSEGITLVIAVDQEYAEKITKKLHTLGRKTVTALIKYQFDRISEYEYTVGLSENDFSILFQNIKGNELDAIVYSAVSQQKELSKVTQLDKAIELNYFGIVYLIKSFLRKYFMKDIRFTAVGKLAYKVLESDTTTPEVSIIGALMKSINIEYESVHCKYVDTDSNTDLNCIISEIVSEEASVNVAFRNNERYVPELYEIEQNKNEKDYIKENGTYLITGGTGGLGLALAEKISEKKCKIILVNHSDFPPRATWDAVLTANENFKQIRVIRAVREIEERGSSVDIIKTDVSNEGEVYALADKIRAEYNTLTGIFHCAGNAGDGMLINRSIDRMKNVLNPKIRGTFFIKTLMQDLKPEFMLLFSSMLTVFGDVGQADYMGANAYMDSFAVAESTDDYTIKAINWPAWKETGMAVDFNALNTESSVDPITTEEAMKSIIDVLASKATRVMPARLNYQRISKNKCNSKLRYEKSINSMINSAQVKQEESPKTISKKAHHFNEEYSETENTLYQIWSDVLQIDKLDIYDNFSSLGGDSLLAIQLYREIDKTYPGAIEVSDIFTYPMIIKMADYIDKRLGTKKETQKRSGDSMDHDINDIMLAVRDGSTSIEDAVSMLIRE